MSSPLAIAAITASLKDLLNEGLLNHDLSSIGSFSVTAQPPDRITTGNTESNQLNVFLYQVTPNLGWRNADLPSRDDGYRRLTNPPLALDLHYLLTAYGAHDLNAEVLLGYAMQLLHENPLLTRQQLRTVLGSPSPVDGAILPGPFGTLSAIDVADQVELIKIAPVYLSAEDLSKLWTAMQARYRPSMAYMVSVLGSVRPAASPLLPAARLGDDLIFSGTNLAYDGTLTAILENTRLGITRELPLQIGGPGAGLVAHVPTLAEDANALGDWGVGVYTVSIRVTQANTPTWSTNAVPIALAPLVTVSPRDAAAGTVDLTVTCSPRLRPEQEAGARLLLGSSAVPPSTVTTPADPTEPTTLDFSIADVVAGDYLVRLRVDGIDSLPVTIVGDPPTFEFDALQTVTVA